MKIVKVNESELVALEHVERYHIVRHQYEDQKFMVGFNLVSGFTCFSDQVFDTKDEAELYIIRLTRELK